MEKKKYKDYLQELNLETKKEMSILEKSIEFKNLPKSVVAEIASVPLKIAGTVFSKLFYIGQNIAKYPIAATEYFLQR